MGSGGEVERFSLRVETMMVDKRNSTLTDSTVDGVTEERCGMIGRWGFYTCVPRVETYPDAMG